MPRDYRLYLDDILESCGRIRSYTAGMTFEQFQADLKTQDAVIRNFQVIGEAANRLPESVKSILRDVEWPKIIAFRNVLIHEYFGVDLATVWSAITDKVPYLETKTEEHLRDES